MKEVGHHGELTLKVKFCLVGKKGDWLAATKIAGVGGEKEDDKQGEVVLESVDVTNWVGTCWKLTVCD